MSLPQFIYTQSPQKLKFSQELCINENRTFSWFCCSKFSISVILGKKSLGQSNWAVGVFNLASLFFYLGFEKNQGNFFIF